MRKAHSNGMPRRSDMARIASTLPSGKAPVSCSRRPTSVDLPWSTWPTMTILSWWESRVAWEFMAILRASQVTGGAQPLERVLGLVVHRPAGALRDLRGLELGDDLVERARGRRHGGGDVLVAQAAVALAVPGEVEVDDRDPLALRVLPDVDLGPVQERVDADVRAFREAGHVLVPELGRLVLQIPARVLAARREIALLGADRLLVAADAGDQALEAVLLDRGLEAQRLARGRAGGGRQGRVGGLDRRAQLADEVEVPLLCVPVA